MIYSTAALILGILCLIFGWIYYCDENQDSLKKNSCTLDDKNYTTNQCTGYVDVCPGGRQACAIPCYVPYYQLIFDLKITSESNSVRACQRVSEDDDPLSQCSCCTSETRPTCRSISIPKIGNDCYQVWDQDLIQYNKYQVGEIYDCWEDKDGSVSLTDKPRGNPTFGIVLIVLSIVLILCVLIYWFYKQHKN